MTSATAAAEGGTTPRRTGLDVLRAVAIVLVMLHHFRWTAGLPDGFRWFALRGYLGVDIFFVLSGWLVARPLMQQVRRDGRVKFGRFWARRWMRTLPLYYVALTIVGVAGWVRIEDPLHMVAFVQNYTRPGQWLVTWSLCIEEHYYLGLPLVVAALTWARTPRAARVVVAAALLAVSPVARAWVFEDMRQVDYSAFINTYYVPTHLRLDGLVAGTLVAALATWFPSTWNAVVRARLPLAVAGVVAFVACGWLPWLAGATSNPVERMTWFNYVPAFLLVSVASALVVPWATAAEFNLAPARWIAERAYALYLVHEVARNLAYAALRPYKVEGFSALAVALVASLIAASILHALVEQPVLRLRDRLLAHHTSRTT